VGSLTLPQSGVVYVDANAVIYSVEKIEPYNSLPMPLWQGSRVYHRWQRVVAGSDLGQAFAHSRRGIVKLHSTLYSSHRIIARDARIARIACAPPYIADPRRIAADTAD